MNKFESSIADYIGADNLKKVRSVRVGIAGAGGLGSNCAANLVRCGFTKIHIVDFDKIENSNLNRQFYFSDQSGQYKVHSLEANLRRVNPDIELTISTVKIDENNIIELFRDCDIVVEAFDKAELKSMLASKLLPTGKFIVSASGLAGFSDIDSIKVNYIKDNLVVIGDLKSEVTDNAPPLSPKVSVAAAKQANVVLEYVIGSSHEQ